MLYLIIGPMYSGKSLFLMNKYLENSNNSLIFLSKVKKKDYIYSRALDYKLKCILIDDLEEIDNYLNDSIKNIFIDEFQFFKNIDEKYILKLKLTYNLYICGLIQGLFQKKNW